MAVDTVIRRGHPIAFGFIVLFSLIEMCIAAWVTSRYNSRHDFPSTSIRARVRYLLFVSVWTIIFGAAYMGLFLAAATNILASIASHFVFLVLTWILWLAGAAAITSGLGGSLNCSLSIFVYCGQLNALEGFAWLIWVLLTLVLIAVLVRGITSAKRGDGYGGSLVDA